MLQKSYKMSTLILSRSYNVSGLTSRKSFRTCPSLEVFFSFSRYLSFYFVLCSGQTDSNPFNRIYISNSQASRDRQKRRGIKRTGKLSGGWKLTVFKCQVSDADNDALCSSCQIVSKFECYQSIVVWQKDHHLLKFIGICV